VSVTQAEPGIEGAQREKAERELALLRAAQAGDEPAFDALTRGLRGEIHVHCYRMLGSLDDADDAVQEAYLRAWWSIARFEPRAPFRAWLYRIATNVCLSVLAQPARRAEISVTRLASANGDSTPQEGDEVLVHPYPDHLLEERIGASSDPAATVVMQEGIELAFVAAVQNLPPRQRAALLLRDVIGYTAAEVAGMLETTVAATNSALQRARATLDEERAAGRLTRAHASQNRETQDAAVRKLIDAWHAIDIPGIVDVLTEDALLTMPPEPGRYVGRDAIADFLKTVPMGGRLDRFRLVPVQANRQPALAVYRRRRDDEPFTAEGVMVLSFAGDKVTSMVRFVGSRLVVDCGLPLTVQP
jgi:RNA polymerase sigma-70 factor (TIGR02960 family)